MKNEDIIKIVIEYITEERYKQAILIDGEWGAGKTFFVKEQLFIDAKENGVCDVIINTEKEEYKIRFVTGPAFQENKESLTEIDIPVAYNKETK